MNLFHFANVCFRYWIAQWAFDVRFFVDRNSWMFIWSIENNEKPKYRQYQCDDGWHMERWSPSIVHHKPTGHWPCNNRTQCTADHRRNKFPLFGWRCPFRYKIIDCRKYATLNHKSKCIKSCVQLNFRYLIDLTPNSPITNLSMTTAQKDRDAANGMNIVANALKISANAITNRPPNQSDSMPPGICVTM